MAPHAPFRPRLPPTDLERWAARYSLDDDAEIEDKLSPRLRRQGFATIRDLLALARWKSPRIASRCAQNEEAFVEEVTKIAFSRTTSERLRIEVLTLLRGVGWPMASVLLHFGGPDPYPILDFRALWSLGVEPPRAYAFDFWWAHTEFCRDLADQVGVSMRVLDRALWQYSKERQSAGE